MAPLYNIAIKLRVCSGAHHGRLQHPLHPGGQAAHLRAGEGEGGLLNTKLQTTIVIRVMFSEQLPRLENNVTRPQQILFSIELRTVDCSMYPATLAKFNLMIRNLNTIVEVLGLIGHGKAVSSEGDGDGDNEHEEQGTIVGLARRLISPAALAALLAGTTSKILATILTPILTGT